MPDCLGGQIGWKARLAGSPDWQAGKFQIGFKHKKENMGNHFLHIGAIFPHLFNKILIIG